MALTMEWSATSAGSWGSGDSTATLRRDHNDRLGLLRINGEYQAEQVVLNVKELRELATMATALANEIEASS